MTQQPPERPTDQQEPEEGQESLTPTVADTVGGALRRAFSGLTALGGMLLAVGLLGTVLGGILAIFVPDLGRFGTTVMYVGLALVLVGIGVSLRQLRKGVGGRRGRYGLNTFLMVVSFAGVLVLLNFIAVRNAARVDLTATRQFSLSPSSKEILANLQDPVRATGFYTPQRDPTGEQAVRRGRVDDLLHEFQRRSNGKFTYRFVDPDADPELARLYDVTQYETVVLENMTTQTRQAVPAGATQEQDFLTALLIATGQKQKTVYLLSGHGERDPNDSTERTQGFGFARAGLETQNYRVVPLDLVQTNSVPEDAAIVVVAGPTKDLQEGETALLDGYLKRGGHLTVLLEPNAPKTWVDFLARWGIKQVPGQVLDPRSSVSGDPRTPLVQKGLYNQQHPITASLDRTVYPGLSGLLNSTDKLPNTMSWSPLAATTPDSFSTTDAERTSFREGDTQGPFAVGVMVLAYAPLDEEAPAGTGSPLAQLVVFGDSDFATNSYFYSNSNQDFFLNTANWLAGDVNIISIRPKPDVFRQLVITANQYNFIRYSSYLLLPALMVMGGVVVWWRRR